MGYPFKLPELGYAYNALEPHIDAQTMEIHHSKHHAAYTNNLNAALEKQSGSAEARCGGSDPQPAVSAGRHPHRGPQHGGGFINHNLFWDIMRPGGSNKPGGALAKEIDGTFGSYDGFKEAVTKAATGRFGSGWAWLVLIPAASCK